MGTRLTVKPLTTKNPEGTDPISHFINTINEILKFAMYDRSDSDMVGLTISNAGTFGTRQ
jgi:hypothetical protein